MIKCADGERLEYANISVTGGIIVADYHVAGNRNPSRDVYQEDIGGWSNAQILEYVAERLGIIEGSEEIIFD